MSESIQITNPAEIAAVLAGEIEGEQYADGETWAETDSLAAWRLSRNFKLPEDA